MCPRWTDVELEITQHLQNLIRIDTTNPPGNELPAAEYLAGVLRRERIDAQVFESFPGRGNVVARLKGDGSMRPLILLSHIDVVPVEEEKWDHPPFAGKVLDGVVWGRGAVDTKNLTAVELVLMLLLKREDVRLKRDVIFVATADEEAGGAAGLGWLTEHHPDLLDAEYAINEGGGFGFEVGGKSLYVCQTAEKGICWLNVSASGRSGHASTPKGDNAVTILSEAISRLGSARLPLHIVPTVREFVRQVAKVLPFPRSVVLPLILNPLFEPLVAKAIAGDELIGPLLNASVRNTATPTILNAGSKTNVMPSVARAQIDGRLLPGQMPDDLVREVRRHLGERVRVEVAATAAPAEADYETPLFEALTQALAAEDPGALVIPFMLTGSTDARYLAARGVKVYGFCPMKNDMGESPLEMAHGHNERVSVANLCFSARVLHRAVLALCS